MPTIRTDRKRLVSPQRLMDFKTPREVKIGYPIRIQEGEALRGDGKMLMETSGVRLDRVAVLTAAHIGMFNRPEGVAETSDLQDRDEEHSDH
jgi:hypothetical protein